MAVKINHDCFRTKLFLAYKPPGLPSAVNDAFIRSLDETICSSDNYVLMGDFNFPSINWRDSEASSASGTKFLDMTIQNGLQQIVNEPTRENNLLDLVLTTPNISAKTEVLSPFSTSDHNSILINIEAERPNEAPIPFFDFRNADWTTIHSYMHSIDWIELLDGCSLDQMWNNISNILNFVLVNFIPQRLSSPTDQAPWSTPHIKRLSRKKTKSTQKNETSPHQPQQKRAQKLRKISQTRSGICKS